MSYWKDSLGEQVNKYKSFQTTPPTTHTERERLMTSVKQEPPDLSTPGPSVDHLALEERILALCSKHLKGITDEMLTGDQPHVPAELRMKAFQRLLSQVLQLYQHSEMATI